MKFQAFSTIVFALVFSLFAGISTRVLAIENELYFSDDFSRSQINLMRSDLRYLTDFIPFEPATLESLEILEIEDFEATSLEDWILERIKYLATPSVLKNTPFGHQNIPLMANLSTSLHLAAMELNLDVDFYFKTKSKSVLTHFHAEAKPGMVIVGPNVFKREGMLNPRDQSGAGNKINRLAMLFHEARHADEDHSGKLGHFHMACPEGHDYAGLSACDNSPNGSYAVSATIIKEMSKNCQDCSIADRERLRLRYLDYISRILD